LSPHWTAALFPGSDPLVYVSAIAGKRWATQWTVYRGVGADGLHAIEFLVEIDPAAAGGGGSLLRQRARLWCTDTLDPARYVTEAQGARLTLRFAADRVTVELPDQSVQTVPRDGAAFVVDGSFPGQAALVYAESARRMAGAPVTRMHLFVASQLVTVPVEIEPAADLDARNGRWYRTSHREEVMLDPDGLMVEVKVPHLALACRLDRPGPPLPDWPDGPPPAAPSLSYAPPETTRFHLEDVQVPGPVTPIGATLSVPAGAGPFPGVLFLGGSGIHDRHGIAGEIDLGTHEIVDGLAEHGFVGLRFDKRGAGTTRLGSDALDRGLASDIADARACLAFLRARPETAGQKLFLIGHSQGGMEALALAGEADTATALAGVVLMATPGRDIDAMIADQVIAHGETVGFTREQVDRQLDDLAEATRLVRSGQPWRAGQVPDYLLALFRTRTWYEEMLRYRTPDLIARLRCPVLVCQGGKDFQVSPARDAEALVAAARAAGVACGYELFPDLDHLFKHSSGPSTLAAYYEPRPVDPAFQACLRAWLRRHAGLQAG
jgi:pimeloyl-ACP methyl ester carboxylesterase